MAILSNISFLPEAAAFAPILWEPAAKGNEGSDIVAELPVVGGRIVYDRIRARAAHLFLPELSRIKPNYPEQTGGPVFGAVFVHLVAPSLCESPVLGPEATGLGKRRHERDFTRWRQGNIPGQLSGRNRGESGFGPAIGESVRAK